MAGEGPSTAWAQLSQSLDEVAQACMPTEQDVRVRSELVARVDRALKNCSWLIDGRIMPYGSYISGIYNSTSDLDLAVTGSVRWEFLDRVSQRKLQEQNLASEQVPLRLLDKVAKGQVLRKVVNKLKEMYITSWDNLTFILHARVPIVKFRDNYTGIECDLAIGGDAQHVKAATLGLLRQINRNLAPLYNVVKQWAKAHGMNDGTIGMFNSHCLALLVIFYLQTCPDQALPPMYRLFYASRPPDDTPRLLQPPYDPDEAEQALVTATARMESARKHFWQRGSNRSLADLFLDLVNYYIDLLERVLLQPDLGLRLSTWYGELQEGNGLGEYVLCVEEPMHNGDNPARTFGKRNEFPWMLHFVIDTFQRTQQVLQAVRSGSIQLPQAALAFLFGPHSLIHPPLHRVLSDQFGSWPKWVQDELRVDMATPGQVLHTMLQSFDVPASVWLPEACRHGPLTWKEEMMQQAKLAVRQERISEGKAAAREGGRATRQALADSAGLNGTADEQAVLEQVAAATAEVAMAAGASVVATLAGDVDQAEALDEVHAIAAATGLLGCAAALTAATELARRRGARSAAKAAEKERKKQEQRRLQQQQQQQQQPLDGNRQGLGKGVANNEAARPANTGTPFSQGPAQQTRRNRNGTSQLPGQEHGSVHPHAADMVASGSGSTQLVATAFSGLAIAGSGNSQDVQQGTGAARSLPGNRHLGTSFASNSSGARSVRSAHSDAAQSMPSDLTHESSGTHMLTGGHNGRAHPAGHSGSSAELSSSPPGGQGAGRGRGRGGRCGRRSRGRGGEHKEGEGRHGVHQV